MNLHPVTTASRAIAADHVPHHPDSHAATATHHGRSGHSGFLHGGIAFRLAGPDLYVNGSGSARLTSQGDGSFSLQVTLPNGETRTFSGQETDDGVFLRTQNGELLHAGLVRDGDSFAIVQPRAVQPPTNTNDDLGNSLRVTVSPSGTDFQSDDGSFRGNFDPATGTLSGEVRSTDGTIQRFQGIASNGTLALAFENGQTATVAFSQLTDGSFLLRNFQQLQSHLSTPNAHHPNAHQPATELATALGLHQGPTVNTVL